MNFNEAMHASLGGVSIRRSVWPEGVCIGLTAGADVPTAQLWSPAARRAAAANGGKMHVLPSWTFIDGASGVIEMGWRVPAADMLAVDWEAAE